MISGELFIQPGSHEINKGRQALTLVVQNASDRPIQVGSHYHFAETNGALLFERKLAVGMRLNIASGTAVRFEPGQQRTVELVPYAGDRVVYGFRGLFNASIDSKPKPNPKAKASKSAISNTSSKSGHKKNVNTVTKRSSAPSAKNTQSNAQKKSVAKRPSKGGS